MITVIFSELIFGHNLEYVHHIYMECLERHDENYVFCIPDSFHKIKDKYQWPDADNISFFFLNEKDTQYCLHPKPLVAAYRKTKVIKRVCNVLKPDRVRLLSLMTTTPFTCFMPNNIKVGGILYRIYRYGSVSGVRLLLEKIRYWLMAKSKSIDKIQVLNDADSASYFNRIYKTEKFTFLPDPVPSVVASQLKDIRQELGIPSSKKIFLMFGALTNRKGILETLDALEMMSAEDANKITVIFAGIFQKSIKETAYSRIEELQQKVQIVKFDEFCSYELLYNLCYTTDVILAPYYNPMQSSGVVGYAAVFNKPVIGTRDGLLGKLILDNRLGIAIDKVSGVEIKNAMLTEAKCEKNKYKEINSIKNFARIFIN